VKQKEILTIIDTLNTHIVDIERNGKITEKTTADEE
jgi:hypothetical protein